MLRKKLLNKRRVRNIIPKLLFLSAIFVVTSGILFVWYFVIKFHQRKVISPLVLSAAKKQTIVNPDVASILNNLLKQDNLFAVSVSSASDSALLVTLDTGEQVIFSQKKDLAEQIASLQLIQRQLTIEGKRLNRVDFRFDNPVISF